MTDNIHIEIRNKFNDRTINNASKEQLEKFSAALCVSGNTIYGSSYHAICGTVQMLLMNRMREETEIKAQIAREETEAKRHREIQVKLEELKSPHRPSFWLLVTSVTLAFLALCAAILALPQVQKVFFENPKPSEKKERLQSSGQQLPPLKQEMPKK